MCRIDADINQALKFGSSRQRILGLQYGPSIPQSEELSGKSLLEQTCRLIQAVARHGPSALIPTFSQREKE
jgi:hypothetical protein